MSSLLDWLAYLLTGPILILQLSSFTRHHLNPCIPRTTAVTINVQQRINPEQRIASFLVMHSTRWLGVHLWSRSNTIGTSRSKMATSSRAKANQRFVWCVLRGQVWKWKLPTALLATFHFPGSHHMAQEQGRLGI